MIIKNNEASRVILDLIKNIQDKKDFLSEVDGKIGDGDHGINMNKGFTLCGEKLKNKTYNMSDGLSVLSQTLLEDIGGSMGPLYGVFFDEMSQRSNGSEVIDEKVFKEMLDSAVAAIQDIGSAKLGDKTLLDTLIPAANAYKKALSSGKSFDQSLEEMKIAAKYGWQSTKDMVAKIGRASRLGERSRGVLDAGATSCYIILNSIACSLQKILNS